MSESKNAVIQSFKIGLSRGSFVDVWLMLDYGDSSGQGFGGFVLFNTARPDGGDRAGEYIANILRVVGVENMAEVVGKAIRVEADYGGVHRIGHITKDEWFCPKEMFDA